MEKKENKKENPRRNFLKLGVTLGLGTAAGASMLSSCSNENTTESGEKIKVLSPEGKLLEVDKSKVKDAEHCCEPASRKESRKGIPNRKFVMVIDLSKCKNVRNCIQTCNKAHHLPEGHEWIKVYLMKDSENSAPYWFPKPCYHCDNPICVSVCPVGATYKRSDGIVLVDNLRCIGCKFCMTGCPYSTRVFNWDEPHSTIQVSDESYSPETSVPSRVGTIGKCDFCPDLLRNDKLPHCVTACPMGVLYFGDIYEDVVSNGDEVVRFSDLIRNRSGYRYAEELGTRPSVYYLAPKNRMFPVERGLENLTDDEKRKYKAILDESDLEVDAED